MELTHSLHLAATAHLHRLTRVWCAVSLYHSAAAAANLPLSPAMCPARSLPTVLLTLATLASSRLTLAQSTGTPNVVPASPAWQRLENYTLGYAHPGAQLRDHVYG